MITLTGVTKRLGGGGGGGSLPAGTYWIGNDTNNTIRNADNPSWALTTRFTDVGVNDHTTYEEATIGGNTEWIKALRVYDTPVTIASMTVSFYCEVATFYLYYSEDGTNWTVWGLVPAGAGFGHAWQDTGANPSDVANIRYVQLIAENGIGLDPVADARLGDFRVTTI